MVSLKESFSKGIGSLTFIIALTLIFSTCSSPGNSVTGTGGATLTIDLTDSVRTFGSRAATGFGGAVDSKDLTYSIKLTGNQTG